jgi:hypothetical protein
VIPNRYLLPDNVIASYDYQDIANGSGVVTFYGTTTTDLGSGINYALTSTDDYADTTITKRPTGTTTVNFYSLAFNIPRTLKGTAYVVLPIETSTTSTANSNLQFRLKILETDGSTTRNITSNLTFSTTEQSRTHILFVEMPITEDTIREGEKLLLTIILTSVGTGNINIMHDPKNRYNTASTNNEGNSVSAIMKVLVPFKVDV